MAKLLFFPREVAKGAFNQGENLGNPKKVKWLSVIIIKDQILSKYIIILINASHPLDTKSDIPSDTFHFDEKLTTKSISFD